MIKKKGPTGLDSNQERKFLERTTGWRTIVSAYRPDENMSRLIFQDRVRKVEKATRMVRDAAHPAPDGEVFLRDEMATRCRSSVGLLRYPSENRWDPQFATRNPVDAKAHQQIMCGIN